MEHNHPLGASVALCVTFITGFLGWINWSSMEEWFKMVSLIISMVAGIMAVRYYYYATKNSKRDGKNSV